MVRAFAFCSGGRIFRDYDLGPLVPRTSLSAPRFHGYLSYR